MREALGAEVAEYDAGVGGVADTGDGVSDGREVGVVGYIFVDGEVDGIAGDMGAGEVGGPVVESVAVIGGAGQVGIGAVVLSAEVAEDSAGVGGVADTGDGVGDGSVVGNEVVVAGDGEGVGGVIGDGAAVLSPVREGVAAVGVGGDGAGTAFGVGAAAIGVAGAVDVDRGGD